MAEFDRTNTFVLFVADKKGNERAPDRSGTINVDGVEYYIDGWLKQGRNGPFLSGKIKRKDAKPEPKAAAKPAIDPDEDIPF